MYCIMTSTSTLIDTGDIDTRDIDISVCMYVHIHLDRADKMRVVIACEI